MYLKRALAILCALGAGVTALAVTNPLRGASTAPMTRLPYVGAPASNSRQTPLQDVPEHIPYRFLFRHIVILTEEASRLEQEEGSTSALLSDFQVAAGLSDEQFQVLCQEAAECERDVAVKDSQAREIIDAFRSHYPTGHLPEGQELPQPPVELNVLQQSRDRIILRARDRVRNEFGQLEFDRFDAFVRSQFAPQSGITAPNPTADSDNLSSKTTWTQASGGRQ